MSRNMTDIEYPSQPIQQPAVGNNTIQCQKSEKVFRPRRAKWACHACHLRKVRCDALNQGTKCTNCKLDMKECVAPLRRRRKAAAPSRSICREARADGKPLSPHTSQHSTIIDPKCNDAKSNSTDVSSQKRKRRPRSLDSPSTSPKKTRLSEGPSQNVGNEVAQWMEMLPPNVLEQLELHSIKGMSRPHRDTIDGLDVEEFHHKCSEKLLQAVDILTEVIIMHNSLSAHLGSSIPAIHAVDINCASQNQLKDAKKKEHTECSSSMGHQAGENLWDIEKALEDSSNLTPESLEYMAGSNFNIWLESNDFDLESPSSLGSSLGTYDVDEAVS